MLAVVTAHDRMMPHWLMLAAMRASVTVETEPAEWTIVAVEVASLTDTSVFRSEPLCHAGIVPLAYTE